MYMSENGNYLSAAGNKEQLTAYSSVKTNVSPHIQPPMHSCMRTHSAFSDEVFYKLPGQLRIHPSLWSKDDVIYWLKWAEEEYSLSGTDDKMFLMNGRGLCILTKDDFKNRSPNSGDVLYELLKYIITQRKALTSVPFFTQRIRNMPALQTLDYFKQAKVSGIIDKVKPCTNLQNAHEAGPLNLSNKLAETQGGDVLKCSAKSGDLCVDGKIADCRLLWDYLYHLLSDKRYEPYIKWEDKESKIFRVVDPNRLAVLWGNHKNRPNMNYEKMSRALRQYYKLNFLKKECGQKLLFRFLKSPGEILSSKSDRLLQRASQDQDTFDYYKGVIEVSP